MKNGSGLWAILAITTAVNVGVAGFGVYKSQGHVDDGQIALGGPSVLVAPPAPQGKGPAATAPGDKGAGVTDAEIDSLVSTFKEQNAAERGAGLDEQSVRSIVRDEISSNPKFVVDALTAYAAQQQAADNKKNDAKTLADAAAITESKGYPFIGSPDAKIEVAYYFDINCHFCKRIDGDLRRFVKDNPDVKLVYREMPILTPASKTGAQIGGTLFSLYPEAYAKFHDTLLDHADVSSADDIEAALRDAAGDDKAKEVISKAFDVATAGVAKDVSDRITATLQTATDANITGTPFIMMKDSGSMIRGAAPDIYQQLTASAEAVRKTVANAIDNVDAAPSPALPVK